MEEKEVVVNKKKFVVHELLAIEVDEIMDMQLDKPSQRLREYIKRCANLKDEDYQKLTAKEQQEIMKTMNELNGWTADFQNAEIQERENSGTNSG